MATSIRLRRLTTTAAALAVVSGGSYLSLRDPSVSSNDRGGGPALSALQKKISDPYAVVPSRAVQQSSLRGASSDNPLDVLVIGGGATGCGAALDAATRGLRVGLVEREDFSSGTSSRSTKLIHGGIAYIVQIEEFMYLDCCDILWYDTICCVSFWLYSLLNDRDKHSICK